MAEINTEAAETTAVNVISETLQTEQEVSFLQVGDIQKLMGISRASAYTLVKQKGFPRIQVGNRIVIPFDLFNEWVVKTAIAGGRRNGN